MRRQTNLVRANPRTEGSAVRAPRAFVVGWWSVSADAS
jgi:hypothetical protein